MKTNPKRKLIKEKVMLLTLTPFGAVVLTVLAALLIGVVAALLVNKLIGLSLLVDVLAGLAVALVFGMLIWLIIVSGVAFREPVLLPTSGNAGNQSAPENNPPAQPAAPAENTSCLTTEEAKNLTGVDVQRLGTENCAWIWRGVPPATIVANCPSGFVCTFDVVDDIVVVHLGVNQTATIRAGTWRYIDGYPSNDDVHNVCALYLKEKNFGLIEVPTFQVRFQAVSDGTLGPVGPQSCP